MILYIMSRGVDKEGVRGKIKYKERGGYAKQCNYYGKINKRSRN